MKLKLKIISLFITGMIAQSALSAGTSWHDAPVLSVEPIYYTHQVPVERQVCWDEPGYYHAQPKRRSATPALAGAIVGGVIGNQFGGGRGNTALTIAGAALGGSVGHDLYRQRASGPYYSGPREHCRIERDYRTESVQSGYRVEYEFLGQVHEVQTNYPPGDTIRVRVAVTPEP